MDLRQQLKASEARVKRYEKILRAMEEPKPPPAKPKAKPNGNPYVSDTMVERVEEYFTAHEEGTAPDVIAALEMSDPTVRKAIAVLRERGKVRLAGKTPTNAALYKAVK